MMPKAMFIKTSEYDAEQNRFIPIGKAKISNIEHFTVKCNRELTPHQRIKLENSIMLSFKKATNARVYCPVAGKPKICEVEVYGLDTYRSKQIRQTLREMPFGCKVSHVVGG